MATKAPKDEDLEVIIPADDPPVVEANGEAVLKVETQPEPKEAPKVIEPEEGLETLRAQLETERSARQAAETRANEQARHAAEAQGNVQDTNLQLVTNAIGTVTQAIDIQESQYAEALASQDFAAAAKIQREMAANSVKLQRLEEGKAGLERQPKPQAVQQIVDPVEAFASNLVREGNPNSAAWIRRNPQFITDQRQLNRMTAAANLALANGLQNDSPAFIEAVEQTLGLRQASTAVTIEPDDALSEAAAPAAGRRVAPPAAPVSRNGTGNGSAPRTVRLTPAELEAAEDSGLTPEEYARQKVRIERERVH
jgi:hypothetical protein